MKIALFGASGMIGSRVTKEAAERGLEVTAITRSGAEVPGALRSLQGDMGDAQFDAQITADHDVIVSTTGPSRAGGDHQEWLDALKTLAEASGDTRIFVVGGAGSLFVGDTMLKDTEGFPAEYKTESETGTRALELLREGDWSPWTLISPHRRSARVSAPAATRPNSRSPRETRSQRKTSPWRWSMRSSHLRTSTRGSPSRTDRGDGQRRGCCLSIPGVSRFIRVLSRAGPAEISRNQAFAVSFFGAGFEFAASTKFFRGTSRSASGMLSRPTTALMIQLPKTLTLRSTVGIA